MKLKVNKNHKKADVSKMSLGKKVGLTLGGIGIAAFLFSGCCFQCFIPWTTDIPHTYEYSVRGSKSPICIYDGDLEELTELELQIKEGKDLSWLNKCINLQELTLKFDKDNNDTTCLKDIQKLNNLKSFIIKSSTDEIIFDSNNFSFLDINSISKLTLEGVSLNCEFLEKFINLKYLSISDNLFNTCIDFSKFSKLEVLDFQNNHVYDIAMFLNNDSCEHIFWDKNIKVLYNSDEGFDLEKICDDIRFSISDFAINSLSDREKLDYVLIEVLNYLDYDPNLYKVEAQGDDAHYNRYYKEGRLYGALVFPEDSYGKAICGNYAALFTALANRIGLEAYYISGVGHAFNLVKIDGQYYYTDPTWLDETTYNDGNIKVLAMDALLDGDGDKLEWYLEDPNVYHDDAHVPIDIPYNIPYNVKIKEIKTKGVTIAYCIIIGIWVVSISLIVKSVLEEKNDKPKTKILKPKKEN